MSADLARRVRRYIDKYVDLNPRESSSMGMDEGYSHGSASVARALTRIVGTKEDNDEYEIYMMGGSDITRLNFEVMHKDVASSTSYAVRRDSILTTLWHVYDENNENIGMITLRFDCKKIGDNTVGFGWSDRETQAGFEFEFDEAVRMLAIVHRRKCSIDSE